MYVSKGFVYDKNYSRWTAVVRFFYACFVYPFIPRDCSKCQTRSIFIFLKPTENFNKNIFLPNLYFVNFPCKIFLPKQHFCKEFHVKIINRSLMRLLMRICKTCSLSENRNISKLSYCVGKFWISRCIQECCRNMSQEVQ